MGLRKEAKQRRLPRTEVTVDIRRELFLFDYSLLLRKVALWEVFWCEEGYWGLLSLASRLVLEEDFSLTQDCRLYLVSCRIGRCTKARNVAHRCSCLGSVSSFDWPLLGAVVCRNGPSSRNALCRLWEMET